MLSSGRIFLSRSEWDPTGSILAIATERSFHIYALSGGIPHRASSVPLQYRPTSIAVLLIARPPGCHPCRALVLVGGPLGCQCFVTGDTPDSETTSQPPPAPVATLLSGLPVALVAVAPCGNLVAFASAEGVIEVWRLDPSQRLGSPLAWSPCFSNYIDLSMAPSRPTDLR